MLSIVDALFGCAHRHSTFLELPESMEYLRRRTLSAWIAGRNSHTTGSRCA